LIPELGVFALILALLLAVILGTLPLAGAQRNVAEWMAVARPVAHGLGLFVAIAFGCLAWSFVTDDFSVLDVATNSNSHLPIEYKFAATWGSHEGSLLLWLLLLSGWTVAVARRTRDLPTAMVARVLGVMGLVAVGFLAFLLFTSNPFERLFPPAPEGRDLNPLLQDPAMVLHPPLLYMGYVGFSVAFAFALAALLEGRLDTAWVRWARSWTNLAWASLTCGIVLGSWWAYYELGWGGWWFWDPVENASFMPWLVGTALVHSLAVARKRGALGAWTILLAICTFSLSLMGTFLVRSGVLSSVHAFAIDPRRGLFILGFLALAIGGSLGLFALRARRIDGGDRFDPLSRESLLLANNVLLLVAMGSVLLGTLYPLALEALGLGRLSVGAPYFDAVFVPLMAPLAVLMGIGPLVHWRRDKPEEVWRRLRVALAASVVAAFALAFAAGGLRPLPLLGFFLAGWIVATTFVLLTGRVRANAGGDARTDPHPRGSRGMMVAHVGVAVFIAGVTMVKGYEIERDAVMHPGDRLVVGGFTYRFDGTTEVRGANYVAVRGAFDVSRDGTHVATMYPEKRTYDASGLPTTEAAIDPGLRGDRYVSLGQAQADGAFTVRIHWKPLVTWIWLGGFLMAAGALLALGERHRAAGIAAKPHPLLRASTLRD
jgi:cytochrome c-type biogenesis protein CcmF